MITEKEKALILELKSMNKTWNYIYQSIKSAVGACRKVYERHLETVGLPPKEKVPKTLIQGRLAIKIKHKVIINPSISYRDIENELKKEAGVGERMPSHITIRTFLLASGYGMVKLIKKPILSDVNRQKR